MSKVGGIDDPVWTLPPGERSGSSPDRIERLLMILAITLVSLILGYLGLILPSVGGSVIIPTMIVFGIGVGMVVIGSIVTMRRPGWKRFVIGVGIVTILATIWTFQFSLAMQIQFSSATAQATAELSALQHSPLNHHGTVLRVPCSVHTTGSVGPLGAPYRECVYFSPQGHIVTFHPVGNETVGLIYVQSLGFSVNAAPDQCVRPLIGGWSMVTATSISEWNPPPGTCPIGYKDFGGG